MATLRELKDRIKAVGNIKRITKTMQMIATAKFQAAVRRATATKPYTEKVSQLVGELAAAASGSSLSHPLLEKPDPPVGRELLLIITSNRGLCGAYNANVLRTAAAYLREQNERRIDIQLVGKKGVAWCKFNGHEVEVAHNFGDQPTYEDADGLASEFMARFTEGQYDAVKVVYMRFVSNSKQTPQVTTLLPAEPPVAEEGDEPTTAGPQQSYDFSPAPEQLLQSLLPITVKTQLFQCFNDAVVSEQVARMVAMKAATDNAGEMRSMLNRQFNRARQAQITTELNEVIGGAEALN